MIYEISLRIALPEEIAHVLRKEKLRFVTEYKSSYKSEPHITLYLESYTKEGFAQLVEKLHTLQMKSFAITLLPPMVRTEENRHRNLYLVDIQNKQPLHDLHDKISTIARAHRSPFPREKFHEELFDPHITLGAIDFDKPQADIAEVKKNLSSLVGKTITVSNIFCFLYGKDEGNKKFSLLDEVKIPFKNN